MSLLAIDPGIRVTGWALFHNADGLVKAGLAKNPREGHGAEACRAMARAINEDVNDGYMRVVFEWPRVYTAAKSKGDPNDLLPLVGVGMAMSAYLGESCIMYSVHPHEWKGQLPKDACHARILLRLTPSEAMVAAGAQRVAKSKAHNVLDAIGIGLHHLGRFGRERVIAR